MTRRQQLIGSRDVYFIELNREQVVDMHIPILTNLPEVERVLVPDNYKEQSLRVLYCLLNY